MYRASENLVTTFANRAFTGRKLMYGVITVLTFIAVAPNNRVSKASPKSADNSNSTNNVEKLEEIEKNTNVVYGETTLPSGIRSRFVKNVNGLTIHILESGFEAKDQPCVLLLHGFPELGYSWRKVMIPLANAGYYVIAPDQRGYGLTTGWDGNYDGDISSFRMLNVVRDLLGLVSALGYQSVSAVVGHDYGSPVAAWCALIRPDVFHSVVLMSAPFGGTPRLPFNTINESPRKNVSSGPSIHDELAALSRPRKHYQWYYTTREANDNMKNCPQDIHDFLRAYYHFKSADWKQNKPFRLKSWSANELAKMPTYYIMDLDKGMAETVFEEMPSAVEIAACKWLSDEELRVYSSEFARTGFQGGLNWYRCGKDAEYRAELQMFSGLKITVPSCFIAGANDWGVYQSPGSLERMKQNACTNMLGVHLVEGAGHWVQQEKPKEVSKLLIQFLQRVRYERQQ
ncbi:MAG: alpha/beta fold hydrolase [Planctomycetota bacterium]|jgi:pimeloyl-ACP methyl ester carboxylesterase